MTTLKQTDLPGNSECHTIKRKSWSSVYKEITHGKYPPQWEKQNKAYDQKLKPDKYKLQ